EGLRARRQERPGAEDGLLRHGVRPRQGPADPHRQMRRQERPLPRAHRREPEQGHLQAPGSEEVVTSGPGHWAGAAVSTYFEAVVVATNQPDLIRVLNHLSELEEPDPVARIDLAAYRVAPGGFVRFRGGARARRPVVCPG